MRPRSSCALFPHLGSGVGLRPPHYELFRHCHPSSVQWVEVITEEFMDWKDRPAGRSRQLLENIREHLPVALHGVSLSLGSTDPLNRSHLKRLKSLVEAIEPVILSDHLCWTGLDGVSYYDLFPVQFSEAALRHIVRRIETVQDFLGRRIAVENISRYLEIPSAEMTEWDFLAEVSRQADCWILLDINNVYVNSANFGFDPKIYIDAIPIDRIAQIHLAGHKRVGNLLIDTHDRPVCPEVWSLFRHALNRTGPVSAMIERDAFIPEWAELEREVIRLQDASGAELSDFQFCPNSPTDRTALSRESLAIYETSYGSRLSVSMEEDFPLLAALLGEKQFDDVMESFRRYLRENRLSFSSIAELGQPFVSFVESRTEAIGADFLSTLARYEWTKALSTLEPEAGPPQKSAFIETDVPQLSPCTLLWEGEWSVHLLEEGRAPERRKTWLLICDGQVHELSEREAAVARLLQERRSIAELADFGLGAGFDAQSFQDLFRSWAKNGVLSGCLSC